jgi:hypothetical protein
MYWPDPCLAGHAFAISSNLSLAKAALKFKRFGQQAFLDLYLCKFKLLGCQIQRNKIYHIQRCKPKYGMELQT